jgi:hypothetical protein
LLVNEQIPCYCYHSKNWIQWNANFPSRIAGSAGGSPRDELRFPVGKKEKMRTPRARQQPGKIQISQQ